MSRRFTEQWERKKWYLIRSLFDEVPILSPIPETEELSLELLSPTAAGERPLNRPYSPLPELIIEKEPNRHDEPEEYYQALERKVMKYYRKLFLNIEKPSQFFDEEYTYFLNLDSESCTDTVIFMEEPVLPELSGCNNKSSRISHSTDQFIEQNSCDNKHHENPTTFPTEVSSAKKLECREKSKEIHKILESTDSSVEVNRTSSESNNNEIIVTQALVHCTSNLEIGNNNHYMLFSDDQPASSSTEIQDQSDVSSAVSSRLTIEEDIEEQSDNEHLEAEFENLIISHNEPHEVPCLTSNEESMLEPHCVADVSSPPEEPEIMRKREISDDSLESITSLNIRRYFSTDFTTDNRLEITSVREMEEADISSPELSMILGGTSTPKILRNEQEYHRQHGDRKRPLLSEISSHQLRSPLKQRKFENTAIQTSFSASDNESNWQEIQKQFFEGNPRIFKLCSCSNHDCC